MAAMDTGAVRAAKYSGDGKHPFPIRLDLLLRNREGLEAIATAYGEGVEKYGRDNWQKGFPESVLVQHCLCHLINYANGDKSEDHLGHAIWNLFTLAWVNKHKPELLDLTGPDPGPAKN